LRAGLEVAARRGEVLRSQGSHDVNGGEAGGAQRDGIHHHVDLPLTPADNGDFANARDRLNLPAYLFVRQLRQVSERLSAIELNPRYTTGAALGSTLLITGCSIPVGSSRMTALTLSLTSCAATSVFLSSLNMMITCETPSLDTEFSHQHRKSG
jgi:hypothetical protein